MRIWPIASAAALAAGSALAQAPAAPPVAPPPAAAAPIATPQSPSAAAAPAPAPDADAGWRTLDPANTLEIDSTKGKIYVELRPDIAPLAVARVKALTRRGYYDNNQFYRVIDKFVSQTGDKGTKTYSSDLPNLKAEFTFAAKPADYVSVAGIPGGDIGFVGSLPVQLETANNQVAKGWINFCPGVAAMTHRDDPNTANSQIFFLRGAAGLDKTFTAFGRVVIGEGAVQSMAVGEPPAHPDKMLKVRVLADIPAATRPQIQVIDPHGPTFAGFVQKAMASNPNFGLCTLDLPARVK